MPCLINFSLSYQKSTTFRLRGQGKIWKDEILVTSDLFRFGQSLWERRPKPEEKAKGQLHWVNVCKLESNFWFSPLHVPRSSVWWRRDRRVWEKGWYPIAQQLWGILEGQIALLKLMVLILLTAFQMLSNVLSVYSVCSPLFNFKKPCWKCISFPQKVQLILHIK